MDNYYWSTEESRFDNHETLMDYINYEMPDCWEFKILGDNEAEIVDDMGDIYCITAAGSGDSFNHIVTFTV